MIGSARTFVITAVAVFCVSFDAQAQDAASESDFGVVVMAHGGSPQWNSGVLEAVAPLQDRVPLEVAFGMADAVSIQDAVAALEARGVERIGVVRLFVSGESWYERTGQILGLREGAPPRPATKEQDAGHDSHGGDGGHSMEFWRVESDAQFALSRDGLIDAPQMSNVIIERVQALSTDPADEDVLILAHGPDDDAENERWLEQLRMHADRVRAAIPVHDILVATLREDWPEKRAVARARIREFVRDAAQEGRTAIVVPFRVHGFGPYAEVLEGLDYVSDGTGLVPHSGVTEWIRTQAELLR